MNDLTPKQLEHLESAHQVYDRSDGVARARLLAALTAEVPPRSQSTRMARFKMIRRYGTRVAMAAALVTVLVGVWQWAQPRNLFAQTAQAMVKAGGYSCDLIQIQSTPGIGDNPNHRNRLFWSSSGADRMESLENGEVRSIDIHRPGEPGVVLLPKTKQYRITPKRQPQEFSFGLFARLSDYKGTAGPPLDVQNIEGRQAEEYVVPWGRVIGDADHKDGQMRMWLDPTTNLPVRVDLVGLGPKAGDVLRLENFRWGPQDAKLFDTTPPDGYAKLPTLHFKADEITEYVVFGLSTFAKYNGGKYPTVKYVYGDEQREALRKLMGMDAKAQGGWQPIKGQKWDKTKQEEFAHGCYGMTHINGLQREEPECVYNGKTVTAKDGDKVLLRWKLDDGQYRVIFGNLKAETVSPERLREVEAR